MTDEEIDILKANVKFAYWAPDNEGVFRKVLYIANDWDDEGPCAMFNRGEYAPLFNCSLSDFVVAERLILEPVSANTTPDTPPEGSPPAEPRP